MIQNVNVQLKPGFAFAKASFKKEKNLFASKLDLN